MISAACHDLLLESQRFSYKFGGGLFTHLPMALLALDRMGADAARLRAFFDSYSKQLRPITPRETELAEEFRGQRLDDVLPRLEPGVASQAFHGLIRLAYAVDSGDDVDVPGALAAWTLGFSELPIGGTSRFETFTDALEALAADERLPRSVDGSGISGRIANVVKLPAFRDYSGAIEHLDLGEIAMVSTKVYASTGDFTALHMVTSCHAIRVLNRFPLDRFAAAILAAYVTIGRPPIASLSLEDLPDDATLCAHAVPSDDDHDLKLVYSCLREEAAYRTGYHRLAAAVRLGLHASPVH